MTLSTLSQNLSQNSTPSPLVLDLLPAPDELTQARDLCKMWLRSILAGEKRKKYKVPSRITWLPCGCTRERTSECDCNNTWILKRDNETFTHTNGALGCLKKFQRQGDDFYTL